MPQALDVDREQVRMLVLSIGVREAARKMHLSENTVLAWSNREGWLDQFRDQGEKRPLSMRPTNAIGAIKPADALANTLMEDGNETRIQGMRYARRVTTRAAELAQSDPDVALTLAGDVKSALQSAALAGSWKDGSGETSVSLQFFSIVQDREPVERPVIDVEQA